MKVTLGTVLPIVWTWHVGNNGGGDWFGDCNTLLGLPLQNNMNWVSSTTEHLVFHSSGG